MEKIKIGVVSLGCDKNRVDSETILYRISNPNYIITGNEQDADVVIINTCAFIESAKTEAINTILDFVAIKEDKPNFKIIVCGCMAVRYPHELMNDIPEIDAVVGFRDYDKICDVIDRVRLGERLIILGDKEEITINRTLSTPYHYAYLKIADGCSNHCTYCAIPKIRGEFRSRTIESLVEEAKELIRLNGVKELILVAQDVTRYGYDLYNEYKIIDLIHELSKLDVSWIRLLYCYPELVTKELVTEIATNPKVVKYIDIPLQHIDSEVLKRMNRRIDEEHAKATIDMIREIDPNIAIRSTFITGFPMESEENFGKLRGFVEEYKLDYAGFFAYSNEEGTAADRMNGQIEQSVRECRRDELKEIQLAVIETKMQKLVGKTFKTVYEDIDYHINKFVGRTEFMAPDVDNRVLFEAKTPLDIGEFYDVKITAVDGIDLVGELVGKSI